MYAFGWCSEIQQAERLRSLGFDYIECALVSLNLENEKDYAERLPLFLNSPLPVNAFNIFFPGDMKVVGPEVDQERLRRYIYKAANALNHIGVKTVVLGSGKSRNIPDGWERDRAEEQFIQLLAHIGEALTGTGVTLALEPLNKKESNLVNSVSEAVMFASQANHPSIRVLADFYHMDEENEPLQTLVDNKAWLQHIHLADTGRFYPGSGNYPYDQFVSALKASGYEGMISAECTVKDPETELPASLAYIKETFRL
ncbi:sugar phosphate isomerase/epimerase family protein [Paenibacillus aceris]|uniref:Sugar phosphate isomerase/epimerase n=1 Tax=Paenibacillus aceris TaxID=869555 RepID=A0ABS4I110_9BACL|nr:sugar phosphate isomerase/epimerase family protein [Paenibacillus aceris]MBP1964597.1 sugar phosphate isomerase/epimerase [Paenibacillus aceris]NHW35695.1 sugar phosphate isomerase/epimerase [Paenibacillus aceris]